MNVLLIEDEPGIREGLAALLRLKGHVVETAASCARGHEILEQADFDVVITDWRLGDGTAEGIATRCSSRLVVMTGYPQEVGLERDADTVIMRKPVAPRDLLGVLTPSDPPSASGAMTTARLPELPTDLRDRLELARALTAGSTGPHTDGDLRIDEECAVFEIPLTAEAESRLPLLERLGGDLRVLAGESGPLLELRLYRDGRPEANTLVLRPDQPWPADRGNEDIAVDFEGHTCAPEAFHQLAEQRALELARGRTVHFLNIPRHLRLYLEILGADRLLPKRPMSGPRLPEVLTELWRHG